MKRFNLFLTVIVTFTAFLAGYLLVVGGIGKGSKVTSGTILDKFDGQQETVVVSGQKEPEIFQISDRRVNSVTNSPNTDGVIYYEKNTGKVFEYSLNDKTETVLSNNSLPNFQYSIWSPSKKEVISSFYSPSGPAFRYFNFNNSKNTKFGSDVKSLAFSPDGNLIAYYSLDTSASQSNTGKILLAQPDGSYQKKILSTRIPELTVSWPAKDEIALKTPSSELYLLTEDGKLTKLLEGKPYLEEKWSVSGKKLLFSGLDMAQPSLEPELFIKNTETREETQLSLTGKASKCTWSIDDITIYCALSKSPSEDEIYKIDILGGKKELVAEPGKIVKEIFLSSLETNLLFITASDDRLYGIKIGK